MNYTEATRLSRQMSGGMTKTALEGWQRAGLGATGGGLLAAVPDLSRGPEGIH